MGIIDLDIFETEILYNPPGAGDCVAASIANQCEINDIQFLEPHKSIVFVTLE